MADPIMLACLGEPHICDQELIHRLEATIERLRAELARAYPIAMVARAYVEVVGKEAHPEVAEVVRRVDLYTEAALIDMLPARLRGGS